MQGLGLQVWALAFRAQGLLGFRAGEDPLGLKMGGCQNYGPFVGPIIIRHLLFRVSQTVP